MKDQVLRRMYLGFGASCVVIGIAAAMAVRYISLAEADADWVNHTHATIYELDRMVGGLVTGDGAVRTYIWTAHASDLAIARGEFEEMRDHFAVAQALTRKDPATARQVAELGEIAERQAEAALALAATLTARDQTARAALLQSDPGGEAVRTAKRMAARIRAAQFELLDLRDRTAYRQAQVTRWVVGICIGLNLLLLAVVAWLMRDDVNARERLSEALRTENERLEGRVRARTEELMAANARLSAENRERQWAAQALEHQLRYNQIIVDATSDLVFVVTRTLAVTRINPVTAAVTGWTEEEILGRPLADFLRDEAGKLETQLLALRASRESSSSTTHLLDRQGKVIPVHFTLLPLRDRDKVVGGVALLRRISPAQGPAS